jgi:tetratricopeptide (TPR) repeat protein
VLEAEIHMAKKNLNGALKSARRAKDLEPTNAEVDPVLGKIHYQRGLIALAMMGATKDEQKKSALRRTALTEWRDALRHDPEGENAPQIRERIESLESSDPEAQRARAMEAEKVYGEASQLLAEDRKSEAFTRYRRAIEIDPDHVRAHFYVARVAAELLGPIHEDPSNLESLYTSSAFKSLQVLDHLDTEDRFPLRHYYRGFVNEWIHRRHGGEEARGLATRSYDRFVGAMEAAGKADDPLVADARARLKSLR